MPSIGRCFRPAPQTDMQNRARYIEDRCDTLKERVQQGEVSKEVVSELLYLVGYLSAILQKHLQTDEK